jgi:hypothetical protein
MRSRFVSELRDEAEEEATTVDQTLGTVEGPLAVAPTGEPR